MKTFKNKKLNLLLAAMIAGGTIFSMGGEAMAAPQNGKEMVAMKNAVVADLKNDTRVFKIDASIPVKEVRFQDRFGFEIVGHLYLPSNFDAQKKYGAIVLSGPFGAVKEQSSGLYAQELAKRGFVTVAFDQAFTGESGGKMRNIASPDIMTEDFSAAVDFIGSLSYVDRERIGAIGICGLSGAAVTAATNDVRIKAVAVSAMYNMSDSMRDHYEGVYYTPEQREKVKAYLADMRWKEAEKGEPIPGYHEIPLDEKGNVLTGDRVLPEKLSPDADPVTTEFYKYYRERAYHPRAINSNTEWSSTTPYGFFNFHLTEHVDELSPRPLLLVTGDKAHSKYFSDKLYQDAKEPKEMIVVPGATHTDLYDQMDKIPFDRIEKFFRDNLLK